MILNLSKLIAGKLVKQNVVSLADVGVYEYGLYMLFFKILYLIVFLIIGVLLNMTAETIILVLVYSSLRKFAGGYHANTEKKCLWITVITMIGMLLSTKLFYYVSNDRLLLFLLVCAVVISILLAPVQTLNKKLDSVEIKHYKRSAIVAVTIITTCIVFMRAFEVIYYIPAIIGVISESVTLIIGRILIKDIHDKNKQSALK